MNDCDLMTLIEVSAALDGLADELAFLAVEHRGRAVEINKLALRLRLLGAAQPVAVNGHAR